MRKLTYEFVINEFEKEGYKVLTNKNDYINTKTKLQVICPSGEKWETNYNRFVNGIRKPCKILEYEYVKQYIKNEGYELLSTTYVNNRTKLSIRCPYCGSVFKVHFNNFKDSKSRCPECQNNFKGEKEIEKVLEKYKIKYIKQYKFNNCKFKRQLLFDFYLPDYNMCIEYDGIQHYKIREHFGGYNGFIDTKIRDTVKNIYCKDNNIELLRIPYNKKYNIENIIINILKLNYE